MPEAPAARPIHEIAAEIERTWPKVNFAARPYLDAMKQLNKPADSYFNDSASEVCIRFLCNATSWRGDDARRIKAEIKALFKIK